MLAKTKQSALFKKAGKAYCSSEQHGGEIEGKVDVHVEQFNVILLPDPAKPASIAS